MLRRKLTKIEESIDFQKYNDFLNLLQFQAIKELREIVEKQKIIYNNIISRILKSKKTIARKIFIVDKLKVKFQKDIFNIIKEYLIIICLFGLKQVCKELKFKNPKKLDAGTNAWIKATADTITLKYLNETNMLITIPIIDNLGRDMSLREIIYRMNIIFDEISKKKPYWIVAGLEGKALFRGRDLAKRLFNGEVKLERKVFGIFKSATSIKSILTKERVVAAQWSAILDTVTCELCASLDGKIIDIDSPDYAFYVPGEIHLRCRCLWVYIRSSERPENRVIDWIIPKASLLKKYAKPELKKPKIKPKKIEEDNL